MSGPPSHQFPASMIRVTTSRTWAAVTSVTSSAGPSRTTSSAGSTRCSPAQRHDERGRPARIGCALPPASPAAVAVAEIAVVRA
jgi:hypothetical protein